MNIYKTGLFKYLEGGMFAGQEIKMTIKSVSVDQIEGHRGKTEDKPVVHFRENEKGLVLNKTNAKALVEITGSKETGDWQGHQIILYTERLQAFGDWHDAIRVKAPKPMPADKAQQAVEIMRGAEDDGLEAEAAQMAMIEDEPNPHNYEES